MNWDAVEVASTGSEVAPLAARGRSLRVKAAVGLAALLLYVAFMCVMVLSQREGMIRAFDEIATLHRSQEDLEAASVALWRLDADLARGLPGTATLDPLSSFEQRLDRMAGFVEASGPDQRERLRRVRAAVQAHRAMPSDEHGASVHQSVVKLAEGLDEAGRRVTTQVSVRAAAFRDRSLVSTVSLVAIGGLGIALLAVVVVFFFARIAADLKLLARRTVEIVDGSARRPMPVGRFDEVGQLAAAINELAAALDRRERDLELERHKSFHHEKMAAVGSLAAGVLTEIGNPIAAIDGYARALKDAGACWQLPGGSVGPEVFLEQTARLTVIAHEIAELAAPQPSHRLLVDLNSLVEKAVGMLRFEEGMHGIDVVLDLERQLPAITGRTDRLIQLLLNLIGNAADAVRDRARHGARLTLSTRRLGETAVLEVTDNGVGMSGEVRRRAFAPFFTTKRTGRETGLGLSLCKSIVDEHEGRISLSSSPGEGTRVEIVLPLATSSVALDAAP